MSRAVLRLALLAAIIGGAMFAAYRTGVFTDAARARDVLQSLRAIRALPVWFVATYALTATIGIPPAVLTLAGGAVFGTKLGVLYSWIGALLGALGGYVMARWIGGNAMRDLLGRHAQKLDKLLAKTDFAELFRLRVNPIVPFNAMNFAAGLSRVSFRPYLWATAVGILPAIVVYAYFADAVIAGATRAREQALWHVAIGGVVIILLTFGPAILRRLRRHPSARR